MGFRVWAAVAVVPVVLGLAGCGDDGGGSGVAGAGGSASASAGESLSPEDAQLKFAQCMRENGVDVPDPGSGDAERLGSGTDRKKLEAALEKCQSWLQAGGRIPDLKDPKVRDEYVDFAQCMREHGVNMPDPGPDGELKVPTGDIDQKAVEKAREKCRLELPGAGR
ncbi:hypothetical protein E1281_34300 [Actinomadura sp. KC345]|uniref:hypothetical protein n=1 Tax=Actinomadura sp. KC345 TaxID=2530371 RepID=UPI00104BDD87|nr:hypothetical protein [Actinomadura sp. KC345]TDC44219.1 hypothetical protein E1281_34300 [Actinomadura sp. KC345]